jgi:hypothetical protein
MIEEALGREDAGVVDQDVDTAESFFCEIGEGARRPDVADVAGENSDGPARGVDIARRFFQFVGAASVDDHLGAFGD